MESQPGKRGPVPIRNGLAIHQGSKSSNRSRLRRVAIVGIVSQECGMVTEWHARPDDPNVARLRISHEYIGGLPGDVLCHVSYEVVADIEQNLPPDYTHHTAGRLKVVEMAQVNISKREHSRYLMSTVRDRPRLSEAYPGSRARQSLPQPSISTIAHCITTRSRRFVSVLGPDHTIRGANVLSYDGRSSWRRCDGESSLAGTL